jgi:hypothetical protein
MTVLRMIMPPGRNGPALNSQAGDAFRARGLTCFHSSSGAPSATTRSPALKPRVLVFDHIDESTPQVGAFRGDDPNRGTKTVVVDGVGRQLRRRSGFAEDQPDRRRDPKRDSVVGRLDTHAWLVGLGPDLGDLIADIHQAFDDLAGKPETQDRIGNARARRLCRTWLLLERNRFGPGPAPVPPRWARL